MKTSFILASVLALAFTAPAMAENANVTSAHSFGSGCPAGTTDISLIRSQANGPVDMVEVDLRAFDVQLHRLNRKAEQRCKVEFMVRIPSGHTLGDLNTELRSQVILPGRGSELSVFSTLTTRSLGFNGNVHQKQMGYRVNNPYNGPINGSPKFESIGDTSDCNRVRVARLTLDTHARINHARHVGNHSRFQLKKLRIMLPMVQGVTTIPCAEDSGWNWGGGNDWGWGW